MRDSGQPGRGAVDGGRRRSPPAANALGATRSAISSMGFDGLVRDSLIVKQAMRVRASSGARGHALAGGSAPRKDAGFGISTTEAAEIDVEWGGLLFSGGSSPPWSAAPGLRSLPGKPSAQGLEPQATCRLPPGVEPGNSARFQGRRRVEPAIHGWLREARFTRSRPACGACHREGSFTAMGSDRSHLIAPAVPPTPEVRGLEVAARTLERPDATARSILGWTKGPGSVPLFAGELVPPAIDPLEERVEAPPLSPRAEQRDRRVE